MDWRHLREMMDAGMSNYTELKKLIVWANNGSMGIFLPIPSRADQSPKARLVVTMIEVI